MNKVQINGCATYIGSKNESDDVKESMLDAPEGHHVEMRVKVPELKGKLIINENTSSLMCRFSLKSEDIELVVVPDKVVKEVTPEDLRAQAEALL